MGGLERRRQAVRTEAFAVNRLVSHELFLFPCGCQKRGIVTFCCGVEVRWQPSSAVGFAELLQILRPECWNCLFPCPRDEHTKIKRNNHGLATACSVFLCSDVKYSFRRSYRYRRPKSMRSKKRKREKDLTLFPLLKKKKKKKKKS